MDEMPYTKLSYLVFVIAIIIFIIMILANKKRFDININDAYGIIVFGSILEIILLISGGILSIISLYAEGSFFSIIVAILFFAPIVIIVVKIIRGYLNI
jgi:hypothetical protein